MHILSKLSLLTTGLVVASAAGIAVVAAAPNPHAAAASVQTASQSNEAKNQASTRLATVKLKVCQNRESAINNILTRIGDRGQKQLDLFTSIATRVETFYTSKGKTLATYNALVTDVTAKKVAALTTVNTVKADTVTFKCDGTDPKGAITSFKEALTSEITALQAYRTSVKNLIVGVESVQSTTTAKTSTGGQQ